MQTENAKDTSTIHLPIPTMKKVQEAAEARGVTVSQWIIEKLERETMPDPRQDLAGAIASIQTTVQESRAVVMELRQEKTLTITDIAERRGVARASVYEFPWRLPNFGVPDFNARPKRWRLSTVLAWEAVDEATHKQEWEAMDGRTKAATRKRAAAA